jgi:hypothetical protein
VAPMLAAAREEGRADGARITGAVKALEWIRNQAFYHMVRHADERGDRKVLGEIKEFAITALVDASVTHDRGKVAHD